MPTNSQPAAGTGRPRGRPRDAELRARVLRTAADLAAQEGSGLTYERIAREAGVSRTTLYRWWPDIETLLLDALLDDARWTIETTRDGDTVERLRHHLTNATSVLSEGPTGSPLRALAAGALTREGARKTYFDHWLGPRRAAAAQILREGIARGEVRADIDVEVVVDALFAPLYHRAWITHAPLDAALVDELLKIVTQGLRTTS